MPGGENLERRPLFITGSSVSPRDFNKAVCNFKGDYLGNLRILKSEAACKAEGLGEYTELCKSDHLDEALKTLYKITMSIPNFGKDGDYAILASAIFRSNARNDKIYPDYQPLFQTVLGCIQRFVSGDIVSNIEGTITGPIALMVNRAESESSRSWFTYFISALRIAMFFEQVAKIARDTLNMR